MENKAGGQPKREDRGRKSWCLQRTRHRLVLLIYVAFFGVIGVISGLILLSELRTDHSGWNYENYVLIIATAVITPLAIGMAVYNGYCALRDFFCPGKSRLAKSIRSQLSVPAEAPDYRELFEMVDSDIRENGLWFDRVAVGKKWIFGDDVSAIERVRVVFKRDEIVQRHTKDRTYTSRVLELVSLDDRQQEQRSGLRDMRELNPLVECVSLRCPDALILDYKEFLNYKTMDEDEWNTVLRDFQHRKWRRENQTI